MVRIGVLALQGAFLEHAKALARVGAEAVEVRLPQELDGIDGLIIPGGESTTIGQIAGRWGLMDPIRDLAGSGRPIWGTCAGMILMATKIVDNSRAQPLLGLIDVAVRRNAFGRQVDSFEAELSVPVLGDDPFHGVFIRAPLVESVGKKAEVLCQLDEGTTVAVRQGNLLATAFHPELSNDDRFHEFFVGLGGTK
ncbi:MAG: pyridoxal 5'-phosphate synthase glutaminase subunit PdxT [Anaerolineales bacterium]|nr:MAG: pyridoxal 5'-phosphate synthase glutaminase subunit PdxT [Anaerolineales bacterium]